MVVVRIEKIMASMILSQFVVIYFLRIIPIFELIITKIPPRTPQIIPIMKAQGMTSRKGGLTSLEPNLSTEASILVIPSPYIKD